MRILSTVEIFSGTKSASKVFAEHGHETRTIDNDAALQPDEVTDIRSMDDFEFMGNDLLWASPPCQGFSVCVIGRNWNYDKTPKTDSARLGMALAKKTLSIIDASKPNWWFIENPRGMLRKMPWMEEFMTSHSGRRITVSYCQYGDTRMKPTDIWTNATWWNPKPICKYGSPCHEAQPRGYAQKIATGAIGKGTQGMKNAKERGSIPAALFEEILEQMP